jgi:hypothetical protein
MRVVKVAAWALFAAALTEVPAQAAWNNVFQPTFFGRLNRSTSSYYCQSCAPVVAQYTPIVAAPPCTTCQSAPVVVAAPPPACPPVCTTTQVLRPFYEHVTNYETRYENVPVVTYQKSYYQELVTTMHTSLYPDPCSCGGYIARSSPVTSVQWREQSCPVQSWVQRATQVAVPSYRLAYKLEPQTVCAAPPPCPCPTCPPCPTCAPAPSAPSTSPSYSSPQLPLIEQQRTPPPGPNVGTTSHGSYYLPSLTANQTKPASVWQPAAPTTPGDFVQGQVVRNDRLPTVNTQVLFVNAATGMRHSATTNDAGRFNLALASGNYHVYLANTSGSAAYHSHVNVESKQANVFNLINN